MYLLEFMIWYVQTSSKERGNWDRTFKKYIADKRAGKFGQDENLTRIQDSVSEDPCADGSIYTFNDNCIELHAGTSQGRRGVLTYISFLLLYLLAELIYLSYCLGTVWLTGVQYWTKNSAVTGNYVDGVLVPSITLGVIIIIRLYVWRFISWENFVQRRLLIRFNRVTRQVYLHRPRYAGGITVLDWEQVSPQATVGEDEAANIGRQLILVWDPTVTGLPHLHLVFVGKTADGTSDIVNLWEFIRRYMEEGPQSVPAPKKLLGKVPWPWLSVMASLSFFRPLWRAGLRWQVACWVALASPALALLAVGHWISLLLCWEPRWPRMIREAGLPGKPVPPLSTAADWPPLPKVEPRKKRPRRARTSSRSDHQSAEKEPPTVAESPTDLGPETHRQTLK
ncbi:MULTISPECIES: DUF6708 domain-containing protein [unclassified Pseudomonas]|uniref:DUF6708 domain-containing protein n=1 Tax=unclassified Pseudomonas TaxID=196821 RepID=UPI0021C8D5D5|nr:MULTISPECIES: DUF6708 domain-containing protein [unclassified Pseudomonas]MCU1731218.1 hypothetical protein [Pseudomonas sp. 20P_3.2_Bac4]MCU1743346.1 hypothetical protein [Pseudomonas sp. 20P_3.2_Bac5]